MGTEVGIRLSGAAGSREKLELPVTKVIALTFFPQFHCVTCIAISLLLCDAVCGSNFSGRVDYKEMCCEFACSAENYTFWSRKGQEL